MTDPRDLTWDDVDPARHPYDPETAYALVKDLPHDAEAMNAALEKRYGPWASGWQWSVGEAGLPGGPVVSWCCATCSPATPETVCASLTEWRAWLDEVAWRLALPGAIAGLIRMVANRTEAGAGWPVLCRLVLTWFLSFEGLPGELLPADPFRDWVVPSAREISGMARATIDAVQSSRGYEVTPHRWDSRPAGRDWRHTDVSRPENPGA